MARLRSIFCLLWLLTVVSSWGHVLGAMPCPHAEASTPAHACCRVRRAQATPHCGVQHAQTTAPGKFLINDDITKQTVSLCPHCLSAPAPAPVGPHAGRQSGQTSADAPLRAPLSVADNFALVPVIAPAAHAPPTAQRKHLLLNVFLI